MSDLDLFNGNDSYTECGLFSKIKQEIEILSIDAKIEYINNLKRFMHSISPMSQEPVDCVLWVKTESVHANDYNPNSVAPPEMELLHTSIAADGYTQPIVTFPDAGTFEVVDGFHRHRVGNECEDIKARIHGYLPVVEIKESQQDKGDRMAATIRHNRARGKHRIDAMSDIILDLRKRNWSDEKIAKNLGMDADEVLRLAQISGLAEMFKDREFSKAWEAETTESQEEIKESL